MSRRTTKSGAVHKHSLTTQDMGWIAPRGAQLTRWRLVQWWRIMPGLNPAHVPDDVKAALAIVGRYVERQNDIA